MRVASQCLESSVMITEDRQTIISVLVSTTLSFFVVGIALLSTLVLTDRPRPALEAPFGTGLQPPADHLHRIVPR